MGPPLSSILREISLFLLLRESLGGGAFPTSFKCSINDKNFPNKEYVENVFNQCDRGLPPDACTTMEANRLTATHHGIDGSLGLFRDEERPMVIFQFWNGGNVASWIWQARSTCKELPPRDLISISRDIEDVDRVHKKKIHLISTLLYTMDFIHSRDILLSSLLKENR